MVSLKVEDKEPMVSVEESLFAEVLKVVPLQENRVVKSKRKTVDLIIVRIINCFLLKRLNVEFIVALDPCSNKKESPK